jgi:CDGSH-type Zn-finger protein/uncharacterized Fe-S cluster protein YjdI
MAKTRRYEGNGIRVTYDAGRCIHAAECVHGLPAVFDPDRRPWIDAGAAPAEELAAVVRRCPTGALAYERLDGGSEEAPGPTNELRVVTDGPIHARGDLLILDAERTPIGREMRAAFCRCGASRNKPYCDGRHADVGFQDSGIIGAPTLRPPGDEDRTELSVRLRSDGPLVLEGPFVLAGSGGGRAEGVAGALCRCGASKKKPFCDGSHREIGFQADDPKAGS